MGAAQSGPMSGQLRVAIAAGYAVLLAVNGIFGSGAFGVPTNAEVSDAYPTNVTPAGLTFAVWGPIFLLQGAGTVLMAAGKAPMLGSKVAPLWLATWAFECAWQLVFAHAPLEDGKAAGTTSQKLAVFVPSLFLLAGGFATMVRAGSLIKGGTAAEAAAARGLREVQALRLPGRLPDRPELRRRLRLPHVGARLPRGRQEVAVLRRDQVRL